MRNSFGCTGILLLIGGFVLPAFPAAMVDAAGTGICWDVRVRAHVPCGSNPVPTTPSRPSYGPSVPSGPSPQEIERRREEAEFEREQAERRRKEEERRAREEADRERRRLEEQTRERREFLKNKSEALQSLKDVDFDGSRGTGLKSLTGPGGLKSGTPTFGTQPDPGGGLGLKSLDAPPASPKEPIFSKGTKFSAPVDLTRMDPARPFTVDPRRVAGLVPGGDIGKFLAGKPWPAPVKAAVAAGLVQMARGRHDEADGMLEAALLAVPGDGFLRDAVAGVKAEKKKAEKAPLPPLYIVDRRTWLPSLPPEARAAYLVGEAQHDVGDVATAARMYRRASDAAPNDQLLKWVAYQTEKRHAELNPPDPRKERERAARLKRAETWAQQNAAFRLGFSFSALGGKKNQEKALMYMREAYALTGRKDELTGNLVRDIEKGAPVEWARQGLARSKFIFESKAHTLIDAMQYARGDWNAAARYLRDAQQSFPDNPHIREALKELSEVRKIAERKTAGRKNP